MLFRKSIRAKLMALLVLTTLLPTGISITVSYFYTKNSVTEKSIQENTNLLTLGASNLKNYFTGINQLALSIYSGINIPDTLYTAILSVKARDDAESGLDISNHRDVISSQLRNLFQSNKDIYQIHLYICANRQSNTLLKGFFRREINDSFVPPAPPSGEMRPFIEATHLDHRYGTKTAIPNLKAGTTEVFSAHFPIYRAPSDEVMAYLSMDLRLSELEEITRSMYRPGTEQLYLVSREGEVLYSSDPKRLGQRIAEGWSRPPAGEDSGYFSWKGADIEGIVFYKRADSPPFDGYIMKLVPYDDLYADARSITGINTGIGLMFLIIAMIAAVLISIRFTTPIKRLISFTQKIQTGQLDARIEATTEDEFGILTRKINGMTQTINNLILKEYRLEIANKTNQLKALQAQINPHFLYNALQSIASLSLHYHAPKVYELIYSLGSMMRYTMTTDKSVVSLQEEIEHVQNYLMMQKERFGEEHLHVEFRIEEAVQTKFVPKMILQPLVENIFKHAFKDGIEDGRIVIASRLEEPDLLVIEVSDNGTGIPKEQMNRMIAKINAKHWEGEEQIGLRNVLARLRLYFGEEANLTMSGHERGLTVTLTLPAGTSGLNEEEEGR
ncbi:sensor histidine kinase [Paenibacillus sp. MB22_1]|uniref:cache domain-containing sensor histidine kinase n=1 Tax=Paenibacillus TaxID=44249 RepID=UPI00399F4C06